MIGDPRSLRVLYLSPWMRPLARIYSESLIDAGSEVLLVTSDKHPESDTARPYELVLDPRPKAPRTWPQFVKAAAQIHRFSPNVVVAEIVRDPRWMTFGMGLPRVQLIHDDQLRDEFDVWKSWEPTVFGPWLRRSVATIAFSQYVADAIGATAMVPLTSDLDETRVALPPIVPAGDRRDFVLFGRMYAYKNLDVCMQAWQAHTAGSGWRSDNLVLIGDGEWSGDIADHVVWHRNRFQYTEVLTTLSRAKASLVHYRLPSQSGVQVLSMQLGVTPIVSTKGALPEFQPPGQEPIDIDDVDGLTKAFDFLADPVHAAISGAASREHYESNYSAEVSGLKLLEVLMSIARR